MTKPTQPQEKSPEESLEWQLDQLAETDVIESGGLDAKTRADWIREILSGSTRDPKASV